MRDAKEANTANMPTNRSSPTGVVVVRDQHAPADERLLLLLRLERRARRIGVAGRRLLGRIAARPELVGGVVVVGAFREAIFPYSPPQAAKEKNPSFLQVRKWLAGVPVS